MVKIDIQHVSKIFGPDPGRALKMLEDGADKEEIFEHTGHAVGLADVSFQVFEGEILVVMGLSGSGKSTLIRCINRLIEPTSGCIRVDDLDVTALGNEELLAFRRNKLGMVFQNFALLPHRTLVGNVEYGLEIQHVAAESRRQKALEALHMVGLEGWEDAHPVQLSGGMQQRVGLARALAVDPEILLMDEAFSALDPLIRREMQTELLSLHERMGKTVLFVSHDLDEAIKIGDRIVLMKDGAVVQVGTPEDILENPADDYVKRFVEDVNVAKVFTAASIKVQPDAVARMHDSPEAVLERMERSGYTSLVVVDNGHRFRGIVRAEDVSSGLAAGQQALDGMLMQNPPRVAPDTPLTDLFGLMSDLHTPLPVVNKAGILQGVLFKSGILEALNREGASDNEETAHERHTEVPTG